VRSGQDSPCVSNATSAMYSKRAAATSDAKALKRRDWKAWVDCRVANLLGSQVRRSGPSGPVKLRDDHEHRGLVSSQVAVRVDNDRTIHDADDSTIAFADLSQSIGERLGIVLEPIGDVSTHLASSIHLGSQGPLRWSLSGFGTLRGEFFRVSSPSNFLLARKNGPDRHSPSDPSRRPIPVQVHSTRRNNPAR
jgi:hypothetical protein